MISKNLKQVLIFVLVFILGEIISAQILDSNRFSLQSQGFLSSKLDLYTDDLLASQEKVNDHGVLYMDVMPTLKVARNADVLLRLNLENSSFSGFQSATAKYFVTAKIQNQFWKKSEEDSTHYWQLKAGDLNHQTIGQGLTIKDFETPGIEGSLQINDLSLKVTTWAQDYDVVGDIFLVDAFYKKFHAGIVSMAWMEEQTISDPSIYILPYFSWPLFQFNLYGEVGLKKPGQEYFAQNNTMNYPEWTGAGMLGIKYNIEYAKWKFTTISEFRVYEKNFIPLAGTSDEQYTALSNYGRETNNWIDFFASTEANQWVYLAHTFETPKWNSFSLFGKNELLLFFSEQSRIYDRSLQAIISYNPSSDYYWSGIRYSDSKELKVEFLVTNNLINIDPNSKPYLPNQAAYYNSRHQYKARFFPVEFPLIELRAIWGINAN